MRHLSSHTLTGNWLTGLSLLCLSLVLLPKAQCSSEAKPKPSSAPAFHFTKVDLDLLRQVNAFDTYIEERGWVYSDPEIDDYLERLGLSLVPQESLENVKWRFRVVRDVEANAFALPNGSIYVNSELIARLRNEAQLAGVLAHEITHVINRHGYLENRNARKKTVAIDLILAAAGGAYYAGLSPAIIMAMGNLLPMIVAETIFGYSRELEHEADASAVETLNRHGYDIREYSRAIDLLRHGPEVELSTEPLFWSSHPKLASRVEFVQERAATLQPNPESLRINETQYHSATVGVLRHDAELAILLGKPRTALTIAQKLLEEQPKPENYVLLGDAYRSLGARTPIPQPDELTAQAKEATRKRMKKMTLAEYDEALMLEPRGPSRMQASADHAVEAYEKALSFDPQNAAAHRGLGLLDQRDNNISEAISQFEKYLEWAPDATDARQIRMRLQKLKSAQSRSVESPGTREP